MQWSEIFGIVQPRRGSRSLPIPNLCRRPCPKQIFCSTNSNHQHIGAKKCVLWSLKYAKMRWPLVGWGGDTPFHPFHTQPHSAPLAPRYENVLPPRYFHLEPCTVHLFLGPNPSYCWGQDPEARMDRRSWVIIVQRVKGSPMTCVCDRLVPSIQPNITDHIPTNSFLSMFPSLLTSKERTNCRALVSLQSSVLQITSTSSSGLSTPFPSASSALKRRPMSSLLHHVKVK